MSLVATSPALNVVVVDDECDGAELLAELLELRGYRTRVAHSGHMALSVIEQGPADWVILDVELPDMSGYELAEKIRSRPNNACRLAALTGHSGSEHRQQARDAGCVAYFVKPLRIEEITALLERAL